MAIFKDERIEGADIAIKQSDLMATILSLPVLLSRKRVRVCVFACARWCVTSLAYGSNGEPCWNIHNVTLSLQYLLWKTNIKPPELPTTLEPFSSAFSMWRQRHISLWLVALFECWRWAAELMCLHTGLKWMTKQPMFKEKLWKIFSKPGELLLMSALKITRKSVSTEAKYKEMRDLRL